MVDAGPDSWGRSSHKTAAPFLPPGTKIGFCIRINQLIYHFYHNWPFNLLKTNYKSSEYSWELNNAKVRYSDPETQHSSIWLCGLFRAGIHSSCLRSYFNFYLKNKRKIELEDHAKLSAYWPRSQDLAGAFLVFIPI